MLLAAYTSLQEDPIQMKFTSPFNHFESLTANLSGYQGSCSFSFCKSASNLPMLSESHGSENSQKGPDMCIVVDWFCCKAERSEIIPISTPLKYVFKSKLI